MKKIFTLLFVIAAVAANSQSVGFIYNGQTMTNGDTIVLNYSSDDIGEMLMHPHVGYTYNGESEARFRVYKTDIVTDPENMMQFCIGDQCASDTSAPFTLTPGTTVAENDLESFHANFFVFTTGETLVKFTFENMFDATDLSSFFVRYISSEVGIHDRAEVSLNAYPNPATSGVTIDINGVQGHSMLVIQNLTGAVVYQQVVENSGKVFVNTSSLKPGVYFYGLKNKGQMTSVKKLVVK